MTARAGLALLFAFLCGSIPFGMLLVRVFRGVDVRTVGSGNIGATNALRAGGKTIGISVLVLDMAKGVAGVLLGRLIAGPASAVHAPGFDGAPAFDIAPWLMLAAVVGHCFCPWLRFRGGKGVATFLGALVAVDPRLLAITLGGFLLVAVPTRIASAGSIAGALAAGLGAFALGRPAGTVAAVLAAGALVVVRHRENIVRLIAGKEPRIGASRKGAAAAPPAAGAAAATSATDDRPAENEGQGSAR